MRKKIKLIILFGFIIGGLRAWAESEIYRKSSSFEWDKIEDAQAYDIEINKMNQGQVEKTFNFKVEKNIWSGKLTPGHYAFRVRSRDYRNVPGEWSEFSSFDVQLSSVKIVSPSAESKLAGNSLEKSKIKFEWTPVGGAQSYHLEIWSEDKTFTFDQTFATNATEIELPVAKKYVWKISAHNQDLAVNSVSSSENHFQILSDKLNKPEINKPENSFVRKVSWEKSLYAQSYDVLLTKYNVQEKKWEKFQTFKNQETNSIDFDNSWPGGSWKIYVRAKSDSRPDSDFAQLAFPVRSGDRSPASEHVNEVRKSIDRTHGWFAIGSWLTSMINYQNPVRSVSNAIGGTGRAGLGWISEKYPYGFQSLIDYSGFVSDGYNHTYSSIEIMASYRKPLLETSELRGHAGVFYKNLPVLQTYQQAAVSSDTLTRTRISGFGPMVGVEYWQSLTPKFGLQVNSFLYSAPIKGEIPSEASSYITANSFQAGTMMSYRYSGKTTGLIGLTYREDQLAFKDSYAERNLTSQSSLVTNSIRGFYINFYAEYSF